MTTNCFNDTTGRRWSFEVNVFTVQRVQRETTVNLLELTDLEGDTLRRLATDVGCLFDVMVSLLHEQLRERGLEAEDLGRALDERAANDATKGLVHAVLGFFQPEKAAALTTAFTKVWTASERVTDGATKRVTELLESPTFDTAIEEAVESVYGPTASVGPTVSDGTGDGSSS